MPDRPRLRILATNDLLGSFHPWPTSYGFLPGGEAIRHTIAALRAEAPTVWVDAGDFAQGGVISTRTGGTGGFTAMDSLGPDVAVAGNHEFDWGSEHAGQAARRLAAPLLCANYPGSGLPATAMLDVGGLAVGVVGCTTPDLFRLVREPAAELADIALVITGATDALRADGADVVVAVVHDGVDWRPEGDHGVRHLPRGFSQRIAAWVTQPDLIVAGHTLGRWIGPLRGTPVLQPWAFGQEIGVAEFDQKLRTVRLSTRTPAPRSPWTGPGADLIAAAAAQVVGVLPHLLTNRPGLDHSLPRYVAAAIARASGSDVGIFGCWEMATGQPPVDGAVAFLAAGPVSEADVLRLAPYQDDSVVRTVLTEREVTGLRQRTDLAVWSPDDRGGDVRVALSRYSAVNLAAALNRDLEVESVASGVRDSMRSALDKGDIA